METEQAFSRQRTICAFTSLQKHLQHFINTSETLSQQERLTLTESLQFAVSRLKKAEREEHWQRLKESKANAIWRNDVNAMRKRIGRRPAAERRLIDELVEAILENKTDHPDKEWSVA